MMRFLRALVSTFSVAAALARPISASELHCAQDAETRSDAPAGGSHEGLATGAHWSADELDGQTCSACTMPSCPVAHCPVAGLLDSQGQSAPLDGPGYTPPPSDSSKPFSLTS